MSQIDLVILVVVDVAFSLKFAVGLSENFILFQCFCLYFLNQAIYVSFTQCLSLLPVLQDLRDRLSQNRRLHTHLH